MTAKREAAIAAVVGALEAGLTATVARNLEVELSLEDLPAAIVIDGGHEIVVRQTGDEIYEMSLTIELYVTGADLGTQLNALYLGAINALVADVTLGGAAITVDEDGLSDPEIERDDVGAQIMTASLQVTVQFVTSETDKSA